MSKNQTFKETGPSYNQSFTRSDNSRQKILNNVKISSKTG